MHPYHRLDKGSLLSLSPSLVRPSARGPPFASQSVFHRPQANALAGW